jgi:amino acid adenylation domain-containing protein
MTDFVRHFTTSAPQQETLPPKCSHSTETFVAFPKEEIEQSIPQRFEKIVELYPDRLAVKAGDRSVTYGELNKTANRIARALLENRRQSREPIALLFDHGSDVIAAILGGLKAGELNVVLDPSSPRDRNDYLLEDCNASLIVTNNRNLNLARQLAGSRVLLNIDETAGSLSSDNLHLYSSPDEVAIVNYTTGSTGEPKGVSKTHLELLYSSFTQVNATQICAKDRISLLHSLSFSTAFTNLVAALMSGASIFPFDIKSRGILDLANWLQEEEITICHLSPAAFRQLGDSLLGQVKLPHLRLLRLSGSLISQKDFELYRKTFSSTTRLMISMGSTDSRGICAAIIDQTFPFPKEGAPLGYPVPGKDILLLDEHGQEVARGQIGEIAVKSRYLTTGYWRQPELTESKFVFDPKGAEEQIYLTGDLGRMMPDGFLIHLGRKDFMVKIRGYRVSFDEIEGVLLEHPAVKEAAVVDWDDNRGEKWLAAYVACRAEKTPSVSELIRFLRAKLPRYMVPASFVFLESLPQVNGKVDRRSLPRPEPVRPNLDQPYAPPATAIEKELVQIWEEVLNLRPVGIHDDFFELGGHSLAATRVVFQVIKRFGLELPLKFLFESPTISAMTPIIAGHQGRKISEKEIHRILAELEALTDEEAQRLLSAEIEIR